MVAGIVVWGLVMFDVVFLGILSGFELFIMLLL